MAAASDEAPDDDLSGLAAELRQRAEAAGEDFRARARQADRDRRVPAENMARIRESGLLRVIQARNCGGHELSMRAHLDVISAIAEGCSSTAWVLGVMHAHSWMMAHFPGEAREEVYGADPDTMVSGGDRAARQGNAERRRVGDTERLLAVRLRLRARLVVAAGRRDIR